MNLVEPPTEPDELQAKAYELFLEFSKDHVDCTGKVNTLLCIVVWSMGITDHLNEHCHYGFLVFRLVLF